MQMKVFAIGDLHLPGQNNKTMDIFGEHWKDHFARIQHDWRGKVSENDTVLIPGDISWAMHFHAAHEDLMDIAALPGYKILIKGNHDYWWPGIQKLRHFLPEKMYALQNDAMEINGIAFCGSRGWTLPHLHQAKKEDLHIFERELIRLELSLIKAESFHCPIIGMTHFPPVDEKGEPSQVSRLFSEHCATKVVYAHLHGAAHKNAFEGLVDNVQYHCVSCDKLSFELFQLL